MTHTTYEQYISDVLSGSIPACRYVRQACLRFRSMQADSRYVFRAEAVSHVIDFFSILRHFTGRHAGNPFLLQPWQQFICAGIFGFYHAGTHRRVCRSVYIEVARKNGKTAFAAGLCLYALLADGEQDAEVDLAANSKEQAKIAYKFCKEFATGIDPRRQVMRPYRDRIFLQGRNPGTLQVFAADSSRLDGFNASFYLLDEYHAAKSSALKDVLQSSQGMRESPLSIIITTAGFDKLGPCYTYRTMCTEVLAGVKDDEALLAVIYTLDEGDDWKTPASQQKANPNIGITVKPDFLTQQIRKAENTPSDEVGIKTKNFNIWCDAETVWIPDHYILEASAPVDIARYPGAECFIGVDLSATSDLTAAAILIPLEGGRLAFRTYYFLPQAALAEKRFRQRYGEWQRLGLITITPGNVTDYDYILNHILTVNRQLRIVSIGYDAWNATQFVINATEHGLPMTPVSQSVGNFNRPTKELERLILSHQAVIDSNEINRHCFRNIVLARDRNGNIKPSKQFEEKKIDGVIAMIMALAAYLDTPRYGDFV